MESWIKVNNQHFMMESCDGSWILNWQPVTVYCYQQATCLLLFRQWSRLLYRSINTFCQWTDATVMHLKFHFYNGIH